MSLRTVVIGAGRVFGSRLARRLAHDARFALVLSGRRRTSLERLRDAIADAAVAIAVLDVGGPDFATALAALRPQLVIHTAGPFQAQDDRVAAACIACGSDYVDLADGCWWLSADRGDGPQVPVTPAVVLASRLAEGTVRARGAMPCVGLLDLAELEAGFAGYALRTGVTSIG